MSRVSDYGDAASSAVAAGQRLQTSRTIELVDVTGAVLATTDASAATGDVEHWADPAGAALELDPDRTLSRSTTMSVVASVPDAVGDLLHPSSGHRVRIKAGIVVDGVSTMWTLATLLVDRVDALYRRGAVQPILVTLVDPGRPIRSTLVDVFPWDADEAIETVVDRLLQIVGISADLASTGYVMPAAGSFPPGRRVSDLVQSLLGSAGHELAADQDGRIHSRQVPPTTADATERWSYGVDGGGMPIHEAKRSWAAATPQGVLVTGGGLLVPGSTWSVPVWDTDPSSAGYYAGPGEVTVDEVTYDTIATPSQAVTAGYARLRRIGVGPATVNLAIAPNPAMRPGDLVDLWMPELHASGVYRVRRIGALPTSATQMQQVTLRGTWDPQLGYGSPADPATTCVSAASDDFDRADQNLEDLEDSPGSPRWTELAWSWAVVGSAAVQRHNGTASLALWNTPMCSIDHIVYATIGSVPAGKWIGPACRSSGQFDGYVAVVDPSGRIRLEMWQAGLLVAELGAYATGADPAGKSLAISADGSTIAVLWDGTEVLSVTDTRRVGAYVGMHALGGVQGSTAPEISSWSAQLL